MVKQLEEKKIQQITIISLTLAKSICLDHQYYLISNQVA